MSFAEEYGFADKARKELAARLKKMADSGELEVVRFSFADQHGLLRGKTLVAGAAAEALYSGVMITTTMLAKDTSHRTVFPVFTAGGGFGMEEMQGAADVLLLPDPATFRILPWAEKTGWVQCDVFFGDGRRVPFDTRNIMREALETLDRRNMVFRAGLEVEFHMFRVDTDTILPEDAGQPGAPPEVTLLSTGYNYLTEQRYDQLEPALEILRREIVALGLPLRSIEVEFGPSQCELTFAPLDGLAAADLMVLLRSTVKQVARRNGYHATFMCRPRIPNVMSSGWHLHQSLVAKRGGRNLFAAKNKDDLLSDEGRSWLGGLLHHARAASVFTTPTINGYKRFRPYSLAPDRAIWAKDNRGVMIRVLGGGGNAATRLENRVGEPAANPYLYMASQIHAGLDGVEKKRDPGPSADTPYETDAPRLPKSLREAIFALKEDPFFRSAFGDAFIDYYTFIKQAEIDRFQAEVTDWEHREYFEMF